jgi:type I restriction enzyme S subunit
VERVVANSVGVSYPAINASQLVCFPIAYPEIEEQCAIAAFLDRETAGVDALIAKVREAMDHLKEFRTALISAAVTGTIDVRGKEPDDR